MPFCTETDPRKKLIAASVAVIGFPADQNGRKTFNEAVCQNRIEEILVNGNQLTFCFYSGEKKAIEWNKCK